MDGHRRVFLDICTLEAVATLFADARPAWVWAEDGSSILWANAAAVAFFRDRSMDALLARRLPGNAPARPHLSRIATQGPTDRDSIGRLRFYLGPRAVQLTTMGRRIELPDGASGALVVAVDSATTLKDDPLAALCTLLADEDVSAFLMGEGGDGAVIAGAGVLTPPSPTGIVPEMDGDEDEEDHRAMPAAALIDGTRHRACIAHLGEGAAADFLVLVSNAPDSRAEPTAETKAVPALAAQAPTLAVVAAADAAEDDADEEADMDAGMADEVADEAAPQDQAERDTAAVEATAAEEIEDLKDLETEDEVEEEPRQVRSGAAALFAATGLGGRSQTVASSRFPKNFFPWRRRGSHGTDSVAEAEPAKQSAKQSGSERAHPDDSLLAEVLAAKQALLKSSDDAPHDDAKTAATDTPDAQAAEAGTAQPEESVERPQAADADGREQAVDPADDTSEATDREAESETPARAVPHLTVLEGGSDAQRESARDETPAAETTETTETIENTETLAADDAAEASSDEAAVEAVAGTAAEASAPGPEDAASDEAATDDTVEETSVEEDEGSGVQLTALTAALTAMSGGNEEQDDSRDATASEPAAEPVDASEADAAEQAETPVSEAGDASDASDEINDDDLSGGDTAHDDAVAEGFVFPGYMPPVRFVWQMDTDRRFTSLSSEMAQVLGAESTDIVGLTWDEVADRLGIDADGKVAQALERRDTWSGLTVDWPVTDNAMVVPVDLAALPAFDRNRQFEGYRGFGVCRPADAISMASATLLAPVEQDVGASDAAAEDAPSVEETGAETAGDLPASVTVLEPAQLAGRESDPTIPQGAGQSYPGMPVISVRADNDAEDPVSFGLPEAANADVWQAPVTEEEPAEIRGEGESLMTIDGVDIDAEVLDDETLSEADVLERRSDEAATQEKPRDGEPGDTARTAALMTSGAAVVTRIVRDEPDAPLLPFVTPARADEAEADNSVTDQPEDEDTTDEGLSAEEQPADVMIVADETESDDPSEEVVAEEVYAEGDSDAEEVDAEEVDADGDVTAEGPVNEPAAPRDSFAETVIRLAERQVIPPESQLSRPERDAFRKIAEALGSRIEETNRRTPEPVRPPVQIPETPAAAHIASATPTATPSDDENEIAPADDTPADATADAATDNEPEVLLPVAETGDPALEPHDDDDASTSVTTGSEADDADDRESVTEAEAVDEAGSAAEDEARSNAPIPLPILPRIPPREATSSEDAERPAARANGHVSIDPVLLDRLPIGVAIVRDRDVLYTNNTLLGLLGYEDLESLEEAGGLEAIFAEPEEWPSVAEPDEEVERTLRVQLSNGTLRPVDAHMHSVPWCGGRALMISLRDKRDPSRESAIDRLHEAKAALTRSEETVAELTGILEIATDGVLVLDGRGQIVQANNAARALFSASEEEMSGAPLTRFLAPESHRLALDYIDSLSHTGVASLLHDGREVMGQDSAGEHMPLFMTIGRVNSADGDGNHFCAVLRDITQWKNAEDELTRAKKQAENASSQKSDFLAKISHEIRTPLNAIIGFSEVMLSERFGEIGNDRYKDYLKDIHNSGSHLLSLVNDLLDLSKVEAGKLDLSFEAVPVNELIGECVGLMQPQANRERVIIRTSLPTAVPSIVADLRSLRQIILNLLSNAIKFNQPGGQVIVSTALEPNGVVVLRVRDTGIGMTEKDIKAALEPFRQLHTARLGGGTGLGLPLTRALVEANRAQFSIDSAPSQGTMVEITFPSQRVLAE